MASAEEKARPRGRHNKPFWYNGVITAPARYGEMTYAGAKCKPQWLYQVGTFNADFFVVPQSFISTHKMPLSLPAAAPAAAAAPAGWKDFMSKDPFTTAENDCICKLSWQSWDWLTHVLATGTAEQLVIVREAVSN